MAFAACEPTVPGWWNLLELTLVVASLCNASSLCHEPMGQQLPDGNRSIQALRMIVWFKVADLSFLKMKIIII